MLLLTIILAILLLLGVSLFLFAKRFTIIRVNGASMLPTYTHGQIRIADRVGFLEEDPRDLVNRIFVVHTPSNVMAIKRLTSVSENHFGFLYWLEGDNKDNSEDSRVYGFLSRDDLLGEVVTLTTVIKKLLKK